MTFLLSLIFINHHLLIPTNPQCPLFPTAIGRHPRKTLIILGDQDVICPFKMCIEMMKESFPAGNIVEVLDCGHNAVYEKFEDVVRELLSFNKLVFDDAVSVDDNKEFHPEM